MLKTINPKTCKTYKTYERAVQEGNTQLEKFSESLGTYDSYNPHFVVACTEDGRFSPFFFGARNLVMQFVHEGFNATA